MYPLIALWSHPRSLSTVTERIMRERGDFTCFHEPFMYLYYVGDAKKAMPHFDVPDGTPTAYEDIRAMLLDAAGRGPVFFKDMSYYILDRLKGDESFTDRITHTFLIRDPAKSIISYHKLDPGLTLEEIGIETQFRHYQWLADTRDMTPPVMEAADIQNNPEGTIRAYCAATGIDYLVQAPGWTNPAPDDWKSVSGWHGDVIRSAGIRKDAGKSSEAMDIIRNNAKLQAMYDHHLPFYEALRSVKLKPVT